MGGFNFTFCVAENFTETVRFRFHHERTRVISLSRISADAPAVIFGHLGRGREATSSPSNNDCFCVGRCLGATAKLRKTAGASPRPTMTPLLLRIRHAVLPPFHALYAHPSIVSAAQVQRTVISKSLMNICQRGGERFIVSATVKLQSLNCRRRIFFAAFSHKNYDNTSDFSVSACYTVFSKYLAKVPAAQT